MTRRVWTGLVFAAMGLFFFAAGAERLAMFDFGAATALLIPWSWVNDGAT